MPAAMTLDETMRELERLGTEQTRKTYLRHGAPQPLSGVNFGPLTVLKKRIGTAPALARELWRSGHTEARLLATMVVDAPEMTWAELDAWAKGLDWHTLTDVFVTNVVLRSPHARRALEWTRASSEWVGRAGWQSLAALLTKTRVLGDEDLAPWVKRVQEELPGARNRVREAMNGALIALGATGGALQTAALATAKKLGKVEVDHGDTACETPDATASILKIQARKQSRAAPATKAAKPSAAPKRETSEPVTKAAKSSAALNREASETASAAKSKPAPKRAASKTASAAKSKPSAALKRAASKTASTAKSKPSGAPKRVASGASSAAKKKPSAPHARPRA
jgi:3-methyladenine DNA glycosylase AlkD